AAAGPASSVAGAASGTQPGGFAEEQRAFDQANLAFQQHLDADAVKQFTAHAARYPRSEFGVSRERNWTRALIRAGRLPEARRRVDRLCRSSPDGALCKELTAAL